MVPTYYLCDFIGKFVSEMDTKIYLQIVKNIYYEFSIIRAYTSRLIFLKILY